MHKVAEEILDRKAPVRRKLVMRRSLRTRLTILFLVIAIVPLLMVAYFGIQLSINVQSAQSIAQQNEIAKGVAISVFGYIQGAENQLRQLVEVHNIQELPQTEISNSLLNMLSFSAVYNELTLTDQNGREIAKVSRDTVVEQEGLGTLAGRPEFEQPMSTSQTYFGDVTFDTLTGEPYLILAIPIFDLRTGQVSGVLTANLKFKTVWTLMSEASKNELSVYMADLSKRVVAHQNPSIVLQSQFFDYPTQGAILPGINGENAVLGIAPLQLNGQDTFYVIAELPTSVALASTRQFTFTVVIILAITVLAISLFSVWQTRQLTRPIEGLAQTASAVEKGDLSARVDIKSDDEIGALGGTFNQMTAQLQDILSGLEQRVEERTRALEGRTSQLEAIADVARSVASIQELDRLLPAITRLVSERFGFYHVGIFLLDADHEFALLQAANSEGGAKMLARGHRLRVGQQGIVGYTTLHGVPRIALVVGEEAVYFNNPDLPNTHSEVALPLKFGQEIIGALDIQSTETNAFSQQDVELFTMLADQVSVAIQNARSLQQAQHALREAEIVSSRLVGEAWKGYAEVIRTKGYRYDGIKPEPLRKGATNAVDPAGVSVPVQLRGQIIGQLKLKSSDSSRSWTDDELAIIESTAERVALAMDSARLLDEAQKRATRETFLSELAAKLGTSFQMDSILRDTVEELGQVMKGSTITFQLVNPSKLTQNEGSNGGSAHQNISE